MRLRFLLLAAALLAAPLTTAGAQTPTVPARPLRADTLAAVTVTATRVAVETHRAPARVTVLTRADAEQTGAATVADLLERRSAVFVKRYGPDGLATLSLRGGGASHTLVLLDGHRLSDPQLGQLDLSLLPAALVESAEVLHGAASGLYGTDAVGGVVALTAAGGTRGRATVRTGAFGERGVSALATARLPFAALTVALDAGRTAGDYRYTDSTAFDNETGTNGVVRARQNADSRQQAVYARLSGRAGAHRLAAGLLGTTADRGLFDYGATDVARQDDRALRVWADHTLAAGGLAVTTGLSVQRASLRYRHTGLGLDDTGRTRVAALQTRVERTVQARGGTLTAAAGGRVGVARARHPNLAGDARETATALFASAVYDGGRLLVSPSLRWDRATVPRDSAARVDPAADTLRAVQALSPQFGINLQPTAWRGLRVKASAGRAFRVPTFNDRFWQPGGQPGLRPERGWTADAGLALDARAGRAALAAEATVFASRLRDQIVWRPGRFADGFYWAPANVGRTRASGWELSADARVPLGPLALDAGALWARTAARDVTDPAATSFGQPLIYVPDTQAKARAGVAWRGVRVGADVRHVGARPTTTDGSAALAPFTLVSATLDATLATPAWRARIGLHAENLTDAAYAVTPRSPMPPRHLRAVFLVEFL